MKEPKLHKSDQFTQGNGGACSIAVFTMAGTLVCFVAALMLVLTVMRP